MFKFSDALNCLSYYKYNDPFLIAVAKCNNDDIFQECLSEWIEYARKKDPKTLKFLQVDLLNKQDLSLLHIIAQNHSVNQFQTLLDNCQENNPSNTYTLEKI